MTFRLAIALALGATLCGCAQESNIAQVTGTILLDGQPLAMPPSTLRDQGTIRIEFIPTVASGNLPDPETAIYNDQDGSFRVLGRHGLGIPPGDYKIAVLQLRSHADLGSDLLQRRFSVNRTPLSYHVRLGEENSVEIELSEYID